MNRSAWVEGSDLTSFGGIPGRSARSSARQRAVRLNFENLTSARSRDSLFVVVGGGNSELEAGRFPAAKKANSYSRIL
jgi:hypothetical protein